MIDDIIETNGDAEKGGNRYGKIAFTRYVQT